MQDKLQELTDKLYQEGLSKGKEEGGRILQEAREEAARIISAAKAEADGIREAASREADDLKSKVASDLKMASAQCLQATRKDIEGLLTGKIVSEGVSGALKDTDFLKEVIRAVAQKFSASESSDLGVILPDQLKESMEPWLKGELSRELGREIAAGFSKKVQGGFTIGPKDGSYFVSFTDETFRQLIGEYLRPVTRKLIFSE